MTQTGSIMGTAQYLSPEQAQGHAVSAPSDLYSVGIILYEMLTGRVPFEGESAVTIALKQVSEAPVPPSALQPAGAAGARGGRAARAGEGPGAALRRRRRVHRRAGACRPRHPAAAGDRRHQRLAAPPARWSRSRRRAPTRTSPRSSSATTGRPSRRSTSPSDGDGLAAGGSRCWSACWSRARSSPACCCPARTRSRCPTSSAARRPSPRSLLKRKGLSTDVTMKESPTQPKGTVIGQDPGGGSRVPKGYVVGLVGLRRSRHRADARPRRQGRATRRASSSTRPRLHGRRGARDQRQRSPRTA